MSRRALLGLGASLTLSSIASAHHMPMPMPLRRDRKTAIQSIPFDKLNNDAQRKVADVIRDASLFRSLPVQVVDCHPELYLCLIRHPEIVVNIWSLMGVTDIAVARTGPFTFEADDGAGTVSKLELIYGTPQVHIVYGTGVYQGPLLKRRITGDCVMVLHSGYTRDDEARYFVTNQLEVFLRIENAGAELLAKSIYPLVGKTADHNFAESAQFLGQVNSAACYKPEKIRTLAKRLHHVDTTVVSQFVKAAEAAYLDTTRHRQALARPTAGPNP